MSTYTSSLGLELITPGSQAGLWGNTTNNTFNLIDQAITGVTPVNFAGLASTTYVLTDYNGAADEARSAVINLIGTATGANTVVVPNKQKTYLVRNATSQDVTFQTASPTLTYTVGSGYSILIFCDGNNNVFTGIASPGVGTLSVNAGGTGVTSFTAGFVKSTGGANALTSASGVDLTSEVTGVLPVSKGGTGVTSFTSGAVLLGNGSGALATVTASPSSSGYALVWNGSNWAASGVVNSLTAGTGVTITGGSGGKGDLTISASGSSGVTSISAGTGISVNQSTGAVTITNTGPTLGATQTWSGTNTFSSPIYGATFNFSSTISMYYSGSSGITLYNNGGAAWVTSGGNWVITGNGYKPGGGSWADSSDSRLKTNVQPLTGSLDKIMALQPKSYDWKYERPGIPNVGFIADDVANIIPTAVTETEPTDEQKPYVPEGEKVKNIGWQNDMIAYLVGSIQELKAEIDALKAAK